LQWLDELSISAEILATQDDMQDRVRIITPGGEWLVGIPRGVEWLRGAVLMALRPFILVEQATGLVVSTSTGESYESWILAPGRAQGMRHLYRRSPAFSATETIEPSDSDAPPVVRRMSWICAPPVPQEITSVCMLRIGDVLGPTGMWPARRITRPAQLIGAEEHHV
jgi:hypothetical protein